MWKNIKLLTFLLLLMDRQEVYRPISLELFIFQLMLEYIQYRYDPSHDMAIFSSSSSFFFPFFFFFLHNKRHIFPFVTIEMKYYFHDLKNLTKVRFLLQVCIWVYLWIDDNIIVEFIGKIFIAGQTSGFQRKMFTSDFLEIENSFFISKYILYILSIASFINHHTYFPQFFYSSCINHSCIRVLAVWWKVSFLHHI